MEGLSQQQKTGGNEQPKQRGRSTKSGNEPRQPPSSSFSTVYAMTNMKILLSTFLFVLAATLEGTNAFYVTKYGRQQFRHKQTDPSASLETEFQRIFGDLQKIGILQSTTPLLSRGRRCLSATTPLTSCNGPVAPIIAEAVPSQFHPLFLATVNATELRQAVTSAQAHDAFRYEWGTWVNESNLEYLMSQVNLVRLQRNSYDRLLLTSSSSSSSSSTTIDDDDDHAQPAEALVFRVAISDATAAAAASWEIRLHVLPPDTFWRGRHATGSWAIIKTLTGMVEIAALTESRNEGEYKVKTKRDLMGGSDASEFGMGGGGGGGATTTAATFSSKGEDCIKYVGGPLRSYTGKYGKTVLLEVILRPPGQQQGANGAEDAMPNLDDLENTLAIAEPETEDDDEDENEENDKKETINNKKCNENTAATAKRLGEKIAGGVFEQVGGLDVQLNAIARRVLASRANPAATKRLGVSHVRGILLSGPPGCGKTLLARELARLLGAREPQIVNGPEILDKYIGEAEKKVRELFAPAEREYKAAGDNSALHIIILDEMDAIARKRGTMTSDTTGVRDSVVNQLLAKMDGVQQAPNILVVGLTNRPELLDPALLRPGRLEVQLRVELPDRLGRRDILRIHTRKMREAGGLSYNAIEWLEDESDSGVAAMTEHFSGAELAGLVRSAASFALARALEAGDDDDKSASEQSDIPEDQLGVVSVSDLEQALREVRPALGKQDEILKTRFPLGISACSSSMKRIMRDLERFTSPVPSKSPQIYSLLLVGAGGNGGAGATALAAWAASSASARNDADYVRFITALDLIAGGGEGGEEGRAMALVERFAEAREMSNSLLVLDDVDQLCAGSGPDGYSNVMIATLRALLRSSPTSASSAKAGERSESKVNRGGSKTMHILAATSRSDAACNALHEIFDETIVIPLLNNVSSVEKLISDTLSDSVSDPKAIAESIVDRLGEVPCKMVLRLAERAVAVASRNTGNSADSLAATSQLLALSDILEDLAGDEVTAQRLCEII